MSLLLTRELLAVAAMVVAVVAVMLLLHLTQSRHRAQADVRNDEPSHRHEPPTT